MDLLSFQNWNSIFLGIGLEALNFLSASFFFSPSPINKFLLQENLLILDRKHPQHEDPSDPMDEHTEAIPLSCLTKYNSRSRRERNTAQFHANCYACNKVGLQIFHSYGRFSFNISLITFQQCLVSVEFTLVLGIWCNPKKIRYICPLFTVLAFLP